MTTLSPWFDTARLMNGIHRAVSKMQVCELGREAATPTMHAADATAMTNSPTAQLANPPGDGSNVDPKRPHARSNE
jgi:hypothetical protein